MHLAFFNKYYFSNYYAYILILLIKGLNVFIIISVLTVVCNTLQTNLNIKWLICFCNFVVQDLMKFVADTPSLEPPFSFMVLAIMALKSSSKSSLPLGDILEYIRNQFPYYRTADGCWMNSVHQTIHWSNFFIRTCPSICHSKKSQDHGGCWTVDLETAEAILRRAVDMQARKVWTNMCCLY